MCSLLFGVDDGHDNLAEESQGDEPLLGIGEPVILVRVGHTLEHLLSVNEIESVLLEVPPSLRLIPRDHPWSVYTKCIRVKRWRPEGLTRRLSGSRLARPPAGGSSTPARRAALNQSPNSK